MSRHLLLPLALSTLCSAGPVRGATPREDDPPSRALLMELCATPRTAGTTGSLVGARFVERVLREAGWETEIEPRAVMLSLPRGLELRVFEEGKQQPLVERIERYDADAIPPGDIPPFNAWSASGTVRGPAVDVGRGLRADYERLDAEGVGVAGRIAVCRYGGAYRGVKAKLAAEFGCRGLLLYSDPAEDGSERGPVWPAGPWKPDWAAQRGSILPMSIAPGDPTTPGRGSPRPSGPDSPAQTARRLPTFELDRILPSIPCMPIGAREARTILSRSGATENGTAQVVEVELVVDAPREIRTIYNVIAKLPGRTDRMVIAGNHRDAWVRGAHDAGGGTVALLRAAQQLGERAKAGWTPRNTLVLAFWDAEEQGLIGSTEWGEAHAQLLRQDALVYVNADTAVGGTSFRASGSPGLLSSLLGVLAGVEAVAQAGPEGHGAESVADQWTRQSGADGPRLGLPGSGSDFTVFLHHLSIPVLDFGFRGAAGGQYHTSFDDFAFVERHVDPGFVAHELAGRFLVELMVAWGEDPAGGFDANEAAEELAGRARALATEQWCGAERAERLAAAFDRLAEDTSAARSLEASAEQEARSGELDHAGAGARFYAGLQAPAGLSGRSWFVNRLWAPGLETGYGSETWPSLRQAAVTGAEALDLELEALITAVDAYRDGLGPVSGGRETPGEPDRR